MGDSRQKKQFDSSMLSFMIRLYYRRVFPSKQLYRWLCYGNPFSFSRREISFTLEDGAYIRYLSFDSLQEFQNMLIKKGPSKIDIGAVYTSKPKNKLPRGMLDPLLKELVFDIDISDYDNVRTCCQRENMCKKCWKFMAIACKILDNVFREDFGFHHNLWVFSGRRGIHCWVADPKATKYDNLARGALAEYLKLTSGENNIVKLKTDFIHPFISRALIEIAQYFIDFIIIEQDVLGTEERMQHFLSLIDVSHRNMFAEIMKTADTSLKRWKMFEDAYYNLKQKKKIPTHLKFLIQEIRLHYAYPRLDINVTESLTHLLKAPFSVHPKTGKVCVPFNPNTVDTFDPEGAPNIMELINEIDNHDKKRKQNHTKTGDTSSVFQGLKMPEYQKTSLWNSVIYFEDFIEELDEVVKLGKNS